MNCVHLAQSPDFLASRLPPDAVVYKDDCMYSFDTAENNKNGLDICLSCYRAYSRGATNYTQQHFQNAHHALFLNVVKTMKPQDERDRLQRGHSADEDGRSPKVAKLEIKEYKEEEVYDIKYGAYCVVDDVCVDLGECPDAVKSLSDQILAANSLNRQEEIRAWEQEIVPCEHSIEPQQLGTGKEVDLTHCQSCDLQENLWICLHCGELGCGRQQYGSTIPGNSHALNHYEVSGHPVAVKLGSLSATDPENYDAYCYQCNDEVKIPDLVKYLKGYGIDLDKAIKTEKNLTEINLDQNMNWQFQLDGQNGEKLKPIFGPNFTGLSNLGNSCYLNSVIQALFNLDPYLNYFSAKEFPSYDKVPDPSKDLLSQLIKIYDGLVSGRYSKPNELKGDEYQLGVKPTIFKSLVGEDHYEFKTNRQQDAYEFLLYLLDKIDQKFGLEVNEPFKFLMTNKVVCTSCGQGRAVDELVDSVAVDVEEVVLGEDEDGKKTYEPVDLVDSFKAYCEDEVISEFKCDKCNTTAEAVKASGFKSFPEVLIVNAKRIKLENWVPTKIDVPIKVPDAIDLQPFKTAVDGDLEVVPATEEESTSSKFEPSQELLSNLVPMGFPEPRCVKALYKTGNSSLDDAMNWLFAHMEDPDIDEPLVEEPAGSSSEVSEDLIANLTAMGFSAQLSKKALVLNNNDANAAVEWLFSHPDDDGVIPEAEQKPDIKQQKNQLVQKLASSPANGTYKLKSVICHKGASPHTGHYVVFVRKMVGTSEKWVLYNDEKVVECDNASVKDIETNGYIYMFERV